ncbi:MAG: DUF2493 domain-containing protein [Filomicrobium sp.]
MRVAVCGGRDFNDREAIWRGLDSVNDSEGRITELAHGGCRGVDQIAAAWGETEQIQVRLFAADWRKDGRAAGPIRNQRMLDSFRPDVVIAFPGGRGTADMMRRARAAGVRIIEIPGAKDA